jgi:hypothetical protein
MWTWISGSDKVSQPGIYGIQGTPDPSNIPGARERLVMWADSSNNMYLFGGYGYSESSFGYLNDLWKFDGENWVWISGSKEVAQRGNYGEKGIASPTNVPGARAGATSWIDSDNNLYLFGGEFFGGFFGEIFNDLWKFDGKNWVWISGSNETNQPGYYGDKGIPDPNNIPVGRVEAVSWIDSQNNMYIFGGRGLDGIYYHCFLHVFRI